MSKNRARTCIYAKNVVPLYAFLEKIEHGNHQNTH